MKKQIIFYSQGLRYEVELSADKTVLVERLKRPKSTFLNRKRPIQLKVDGDEVFISTTMKQDSWKDGLRLGEVVFYLREGGARFYDLLIYRSFNWLSKGALLDGDVELLLQKSQKSMEANSTKRRILSKQSSGTNGPAIDWFWRWRV